MSKKRVFFVRHGETDWNAEQRWQGHIDIALSPVGIEQAERAADLLRSANLGIILSSDLKRATQTAEIIARQEKTPIITSSNLREVNVGIVEGWQRDDIVSDLGEATLLRWGSVLPEDLDFSFPEGETKSAALMRSLTTILSYLDQTAHENVGIVFHGMIMRTLLHFLFPKLKDPLRIKNAQFFEAEYETSNQVWTPRGELEKILEPEAVAFATADSSAVKPSWW
ncbi:MAG: histidine phosphatase family protein [Acidobacteriota bacterium]|nr:MAG: histidine phosphatase family protein [Acidobacteriota bacterium]